MRGQTGSSDDPLVGRVLGQHVLVERIGSGSFGRVYRARHRLLGRDRAVKILLPEHAEDDRQVQLFLREANLAAALNHPNVVLVHDVGEDDDLPYIVMELLYGTPLRSVLDAGSPLPIDRALRLLDQLAAALDHAHAAGVVHRDVKPENAIVDSTDGLKLVDFGIGRAREASQQTLFGAGTVPYMAPELIQAARDGVQSSFDLGVSADRYALGIMAFEMLTGRRPFVGRTRWDLEREQLSTDPPAPHVLRQDLTEDVDPILLRQLAKRASERYASGAAFVEALRQSLTPPAPAARTTRSADSASTPEGAQVGSRLGPYLLVSLIGAGGMTAVYRAVHQLLGVTQAVMVLRPRSAGAAEARHRFTQAAALTMRLRHPNVVRVLDLDDANGVLYSPMELIEGTTLAEVVQREGLLDLRRVERILLQTADALDHSHARGIVHRDVKPANLIVGADDHVTLIDFTVARDLSRAVDDDDDVGMAGTPPYLAPETWLHGECSPASDGWALGMIAYELLTGRRPFEGLAPHEMMRTILKTAPVPPSRQRPTLPSAADAVMLRQLSVAPSERFPGARTFVDALSAALHDPPPPPGPSSRNVSPDLMFEIGLGTDVGSVATSNQDAALCEPPGSPLASERGLFVAIADGYGTGGEDASAMAVLVARDAYYASQAEPLDALREAVDAARWAVFSAARERSASGGAPEPFGTTLTALVIRNGTVVIAHVGNCRVLLVRQGSIRRLTRDHTWVAEEIAAGRLTTEAADIHPRRLLLARDLGQREPVNVDIDHGAVQPQDVLVICSVGLHGTVSEQEILSFIRESHPADAVADLIKLANERRTAHNVSIAILRATQAEGVKREV